MASYFAQAIGAFARTAYAGATCAGEGLDHPADVPAAFSSSASLK
jgi:hypothetical protein